jgi:hypothetical protein
MGLGLLPYAGKLIDSQPNGPQSRWVEVADGGTPRGGRLVPISYQNATKDHP